MQGMKLVLNLVIFTVLLLSNQIYAENLAKKDSLDNTITNEEVSKGQKIAGKVCAGCHNHDGNSIIPSNPILAGQHAEYIIKQLRDFKSQENKPTKRESAVMGAMVSPLSNEDIHNLSSYYAVQEPNPKAAKDKELAKEGEKIYRGGNLDSNLPACSSCHSPNGAGIPPHYPRLAGQHVEYTVTQLRAFRTEQRANDANKVMRGIVSRMSEKEIRAVAEFISGLN
tara:strand:- start:10085 stop:10759 length:675 start_codon:yes stop_codon:yes gene_type:complete